MAADLALQNGVAVNIGGGFHHAFADHGEGFCVVNDVAVAIKRMHKDGKICRALTLDCDVHDGNGTAGIFPPKTYASQPLPSAGGVQYNLRNTNAQLRDTCTTGDLEVFTISLHQANNYPVVKPPSSIYIHLPDGADDHLYLAWLDQALSSAFRQFEPELICYIAGADPYKEDQLGGLALTLDGLKTRDELVLRVARSRNIPIMITFAGGYARRVEDTVTIHCNTIMAAKEVSAKCSSN